MIDAFIKYSPLTINFVQDSLKLEKLIWVFLTHPKVGTYEDISIDRLIMEKAEKLFAVPFHGEWSDLELEFGR